MKTVMAETKLILRGTTHKEITVRLFCPTRVGREHRCEYIITGISGSPVVFYGGGGDSIHAICLAIMLIRRQLSEALAEARGEDPDAELLIEESWSGDLVPWYSSIPFWIPTLDEEQVRRAEEFTAELFSER